jgi:alpha-amylase
MSISSPKTLCFFFELHQPYRVNDIQKSTVANIDDYFDGPQGDNPNHIYGNKALFEKVASNSYIPATQVWLDLLSTHPQLKISLSISGTLLEQCLEFPHYGAKVIQNLQKLVQTGQVELLAEIYHHSLSFLYSTEEFLLQIQLHQNIIYRLFGVVPTSFRNTEMIYNNQIGQIIANLGYKSIVIEDKESSLEYESPHKIAINNPVTLSEDDQNIIEKSKTHKPRDYLLLLQKNYTLVWHFFMLAQHTPEHLFEITERENDRFVGIFCDFEIFGEHNSQTHDTFEILQTYIDLLVENDYEFTTPSQTELRPSVTELDIPDYISWTNSWHDLSSWRGNSYQENAFSKLQELHEIAMKLYDNQAPQAQQLLKAYRKLTTSDHFYYMSDLPGADGEMHAIFNAYPSPKDAYETYVTVLDSISQKITDFLN